MKKVEGWILMFLLAVLAISVYIRYRIAVSDLPDWVKFSMLSR